MIWSVVWRYLRLVKKDKTDQPKVQKGCNAMEMEDENRQGVGRHNCRQTRSLLLYFETCTEFSTPTFFRRAIRLTATKSSLFHQENAHVNENNSNIQRFLFIAFISSIFKFGSHFTLLQGKSFGGYSGN